VFAWQGLSSGLPSRRSGRSWRTSSAVTVFGEAGADLVKMAQPALGVVGTEQQGCEGPSPAAFAGAPATDDDLLCVQQRRLIHAGERRPGS
jgi:hypothetical protein